MIMDLFMRPMPVFQWVVSESPVAVLAVVLILASRKWPGQRVHPKIFYGLWILLIIRLLCPWFPTVTPPWDAASHIFPSHAGLDFLSGGSPESAAAERTGKPESSSIDFTESAGLQTATAGWLDIAYLGWLIGGFVLAAGYVYLYFRWNRRVHHESFRPRERRLETWLAECKETLGIRRHIGVKITPLVSTPATYGLWKPQIFLPPHLLGRLDEEEWKCIFLHELIHIQRKDVLWNALMSALVVLHWFNPFMWKAYMKMREEQEMSCDLKTLKYVDNDRYGRTLIKLVEIRHNKNALSLVPFLFGERKFIKRRIEMIVSKKRPALTFLVAGILTVFAVIIFTNPGLTAQSRDAESDIDSFVSPSAGEIVLRFGEAKKTGNKEELPSSGIEIANVEGTPIRAAADGVIEQAEYVPVEGNRIQIAHSDSYKTIYGHLKEIHVEIGQTVKKGQLIGTMGSTGRSVGTHLWFAVEKNGEFVDPEAFIDFTKSFGVPPAVEMMRK